MIFMDDFHFTIICTRLYKDTSQNVASCWVQNTVPGSVTHHTVIIVASPPVHNPPSIIHPPASGSSTRVLLPAWIHPLCFAFDAQGITSFTNPPLFVSLIPPPVPLSSLAPHPSPHQPSCSISLSPPPPRLIFSQLDLVSSQPLAWTLHRANNYTYHWKVYLSSCHHIFSVFRLTPRLRYIQSWTRLLEKEIELCGLHSHCHAINGKFQKDGRPLILYNIIIMMFLLPYY